MYDFPELAEATNAFWTALAGRLTAGRLAAGIRITPPASLDRSLGHTALWRHPQLLLGQGCEYPLAKSFAGHIRWLATPCYAAAGCEGGYYRSAIVVRADDGVDSIAGLRGRRCIINERDSNSGMNLLRAAIAPLAGGRAFFEGITISGSHRQSAEAVAEGMADVTALDCVSYAHFQRLYPSLTRRLRRLDWTPASPSLPFITGRAAGDAVVEALRAALQEVMTDPSLKAVRDALLLSGITAGGGERYADVLGYERTAAALGYPELR